MPIFILINKAYFFQWRVRASLANSMHEIALIVGSPSTAADLLPVFNSFREDVPEVRMGILKHLYEFFKVIICLSLLLLYTCFSVSA